ncbi:PAS-domain containing protein [Sulfitobacter sp. HNIBRBA3233]|uniref:PAS-domain containing protein n=1 Tax=Sulfitobacter marinivivus TaxID=3158558 RepID=UPI0032DEA7E8
MFYYVIGFLAGLPILLLVAIWATGSGERRGVDPAEPARVFLFRNGILEHATPSALAAYPLLIGSNGWDDLRTLLEKEFEGLPHDITRQVHAATLESRNGGPALRIEIMGKVARVTVPDGPLTDQPDDHGPAQSTDDAGKLSDALPVPAWRTDRTGRIVWSNAAFDALRARMRLPPDQHDGVFVRQDAETMSRIAIDVHGDESPEWYNIETRDAGDDGQYHFAISQTDLVSAENTRRSFVQTLAKTFANLQIGLAIFNSDRRLVLFNPALSELSGLDIAFLGPKPDLDSFFDAMRERRRMPEPKNYRDWRRRINDLVTAAEGDAFTETWSLENGQTLRVKGQPHPEGALAFLIEDISAEVSLTRNFRAELELGQSMLDTFEDALAVFSQQGVLTFSNRAYDTLWGFSAESSFADVTITDALQLWRACCDAGPDWRSVETSVLTFGDREALSFPVRPKNGDTMVCGVVPITAGATLIRFRATAEADRSLQPAQ